MIHTVGITDQVKLNYPAPIQGELLTCMDTAARLGFDGVEIHMRNPAAEDPCRLADEAAKRGLRITTIGTGMACYADGHYMTNPDLAARKDAEKVLSSFFYAGQVCGAKAIMFGLMKGPLPDPQMREQQKDILYEALLPIVDTAERTGVDLTIEAINRFQSSFLWSTDETLEFVNRFKSDRVTIHLDVFHMNIEDDGFYKNILKCGKRLGHFHFTDNDRCYPGHSRMNFKEIYDALYDVGYAPNGIASHEYNPVPDSETACKKGLAFLKQFER
ncbi:MAG: TIM barrel protein [Lawsonibacter sp.]